MSKKNENPYNVRSGYGKLFAFWKKKQVVTLKDMLAEGKNLGMNPKASVANVNVVISPRKDKTVCIGDPRGNYSAKGHLYYADKLKRKSGEDIRFRLRYRETPLEPRNRKIKEEITAEKVKVTETVAVSSDTNVEVPEKAKK